MRRDRRGRGMRGPLVPVEVPLHESRAERFDRVAADAVAHVETRWHAELADVEFAVDLVPEADDTRPVPDQVESGGVALARVLPGSEESAARLVLYRKPIELRARDLEELEDLLHDVVVQIVAVYLGMAPEVVDPGFEDLGDDG